MKPVLIIVTMLLAAPADAACYADYKASRNQGGLQLAYGVMEIRGQCDAASAKSEAASRLARGGWTLLQVLGTFGDEGLAERVQRVTTGHNRNY